DRVETVDAEGHADWDVYLTNVYACGYVKNQPTGGGGADAGGGELPQNPCGDSVLSGEGTLTMLLQAIDDATAGLDKQACKDLFQGRDAAKFLGDLFGGGYINLQTQYAKYDNKKHQWRCKRFDGHSVGAVSSTSLAQVPGPNGPTTAGLIQINANGFFV